METTTVTNYLARLEPPLREISERLLPVIEAALPAATGAMWHGHPVWGLGDRPGRRPVCLLKTYGSYVTFGLWRGREIGDPSARLVPGARQMASVRLRALADVDPALFTDWLRRAHDLEER
ncbi:DUF1801 domain-containing protein [Micromonospora sp. CPCC 205561]|uniref:DUF1801 domain-containing protein n=1 Tax=Micromonospora sp. CPCC 205561 TaxID=3122407 RepID=UPI002FEF9AD1